MKTAILSAAYESPKVREVLIVMENAICTVSVLEGVEHDGFEDGGVIPF